MKKTIALLSVVATVTAMSYLYLINSSLPQPTTSSIQENTSIEPLALMPLEVEKSTKSIVSNEAEIFKNDAMKLQLKAVSKAFERNIKYPIQSQPMNENRWDLLNPNAFIKNKRALSEDSDLSASIALSSYVMFNDAPIELSVTISGSDNALELIDYKAEIISQNKIVDTINLNIDSSSDSNVILKGSLTPENAVNWGADLQVRVSLDLNQGNTNVFVSSFKYMEKLVELTRVLSSYVDSTDLIIPLVFEVKEAGRYITSANLFSKQTGKPIAHLFSKENLSSSQTQMNLTVHSSLLRDLKEPGPYELKNFNIKRLPAKPGDKTGYGYTKIITAPVNGFDLEQYSDEPYVNLQAQQRLEFLQQLAN